LLHKYQLKKLLKMKKSILSFGLFLMALFALNINAQKIGNGPEITFEKEVHDYGTIEVGANGNCEFVFKNTGSEPLIIEKAVAPCGCTVPDWPKTPIAPGATASIKVTYDTKRIGLINKTVTITSNATNAPNAEVRIKGEVKNADSSATPVKTPVGPVNK
jgi:hypothetical protein